LVGLFAFEAANISKNLFDQKKIVFNTLFSLKNLTFEFASCWFLCSLSSM
jgi:hypothetical protein